VEADPHPAPPQPARAFIPVLAKPRTAVINTSQHNPARGRAAGLPTLAGALAAFGGCRWARHYLHPVTGGT